jgi:hypothetical protein
MKENHLKGIVLNYVPDVKRIDGRPTVRQVGKRRFYLR